MLLFVTLALAAYRDTLAAFPTLTLTQTRRFRSGQTIAEVLAAAPPTPDQTATLRFVRSGGRQRLTTVADPASRKKSTEAQPTFNAKLGLKMGPLLQSIDTGRLADGSGRNLTHSPDVHYASVSTTPAELNPLVDIITDVLRGGSSGSVPADLPACVAAALAGRVTATADRSAAGRPVYTFTGDGGTASFELDPAAGHLPVRVRSAVTGGDPANRVTREVVLEPRACTRGRWFPARAVVSFMMTEGNAMGWEFVVTELDADTPPPDAALKLVLPAGTRVVDEDSTTVKMLVLSADTAVGPDDLADLQARTTAVPARPAPRDRRVVGGDGPTPAERRTSRWWWWGGGLAVVVLTAAAVVVYRRRRQ